MLWFLNLSSSGSSSLSFLLGALMNRSTRKGTTTSDTWFTSWVTISRDARRFRHTRKYQYVSFSWSTLHSFVSGTNFTPEVLLLYSGSRPDLRCPHLNCQAIQICIVLCSLTAENLVGETTDQSKLCWKD